jgi:hypothetical protein
MYGYDPLAIGDRSLDDTVKVLQARLSGGQMESRGGRTIAFSGEESKIMGQTLEHLKASQGARVGVQSMETASKAQRAVEPIVRAGGTGVMSPGTLSNVIQSTENAIKVMRGIL